MNRIREIRFGKPKTGKTKNVVESYPTPILVISTDLAGLDSVKSKPVVTIKREELPSYLKKMKAELPPILCIEYIYAAGKRISTEATIKFQDQTFKNIAADINSLFDNCPFETLVIDGLTGINEAAIGLVGTLNPKLMLDARSWGGLAGAKIQEVIACSFALPTQNVILLGHEVTTQNDKTQEISTNPYMVSKIREVLGGLPSAFLYSAVEPNGNGGVKYVVYKQPVGNVKGLGTRDDSTVAVTGPRFEDIYGKRN